MRLLFVKESLVWPRIELAVRLLPGLRKPNLERMAATLGVEIVHRHRAEGDARLTAESLHRLLPLAKQAGRLRLSARDLRRWVRITGFEPVGIRCVDDLANYVRAWFLGRHQVHPLAHRRGVPAMHRSRVAVNPNSAGRYRKDQSAASSPRLPRTRSARRWPGLRP